MHWLIFFSQLNYWDVHLTFSLCILFQYEIINTNKTYKTPHKHNVVLFSSLGTALCFENTNRLVGMLSVYLLLFYIEVTMHLILKLRTHWLIKLYLYYEIATSKWSIHIVNKIGQVHRKCSIVLSSKICIEYFKMLHTANCEDG